MGVWALDNDDQEEGHVRRIAVGVILPISQCVGHDEGSVIMFSKCSF